MLHEQLVGRSVRDDLVTLEEFQRLMQGRGQVEPDEDALGDAVAFAGVAKYPARVKCALLGWMAWKDAVAQAVAASAEGAS
jgi:nitrogen fixation NifU-like protein